MTRDDINQWAHTYTYIHADRQVCTCILHSGHPLLHSLYRDMLMLSGYILVHCAHMSRRVCVIVLVYTVPDHCILYMYMCKCYYDCTCVCVCVYVRWWGTCWCTVLYVLGWTYGRVHLAAYGTHPTTLDARRGVGYKCPENPLRAVLMNLDWLMRKGSSLS